MAPNVGRWLGLVAVLAIASLSGHREPVAPARPPGPRLVAWGTPGDLRPVAPGVSRSRDDRLEIVRADPAAPVEWFVRRAIGVEHGFDLPAPPRGEGPAVLDLDVGDAEVVVAPEGRMATLHAPDGQRTSYGPVRAWDARGTDLPSRMIGTDRGLAIEVDDDGARYPVTVDPMTLTYITLQASDAAAGSEFGASVAIDGNVVVVGAPEAYGARGAVYVFELVDSAWVETARHVGSGTVWVLGRAVDVEGDTIVATSYGGDYGMTHFYERSGDTWVEDVAIEVAEPDSTIDYTSWYGHSVALAGDHAAVGDAWARAWEPEVTQDSGVVFLYSRALGAWGPASEMRRDEYWGNFGTGLAMAGDELVVGSPFSFDQEGSAFVYRWTGSWTLTDRLRGAGSTATLGRGQAVAIDGTTLLTSLWKTGVTEVYEGGSGAWSEVAELTACSVGSGDELAVDGAYAVTTENDAVCIATRTPGGWVEDTRFALGHDGSGDPTVGVHSVDLDGEIIAVGAAEAHTPDGIGDAGLVYLYTFFPPGLADGEACSTDIECENYCVDGVCCDTPCGGGVDGDCRVCAASLGATADGVCTTLPDGTTCDGGACDAGVCETVATCGDGTCDDTEDCSSCEVDCGACCGDGVCGAGEDCETCEGDCGSCCGNGTLDAGEDCDGAELAGVVCETLGYDEGDLACTDACLFDTAGCVILGDTGDTGEDTGDTGDTDPPEECTEVDDWRPPVAAGSAELELDMTVQGVGVTLSTTYEAEEPDQEEGKCVSGVEYTGELGVCLAVAPQTKDCVNLGVGAKRTCVAEPVCETPPTASCEGGRQCCTTGYSVETSYERVWDAGIEFSWEKLGYTLAGEGTLELSYGLGVEIELEQTTGDMCDGCPDDGEVHTRDQVQLEVKGGGGATAGLETKLFGREWSVSAEGEACVSATYAVGVCDGSMASGDTALGTKGSLKIPKIGWGWFSISAFDVDLWKIPEDFEGCD